MCAGAKERYSGCGDVDATGSSSEASSILLNGNVGQQEEDVAHIDGVARQTAEVMQRAVGTAAHTAFQT
jgi:hypothetical protein